MVLEKDGEIISVALLRFGSILSSVFFLLAIVHVLYLFSDYFALAYFSQYQCLPLLTLYC